MAAEMEEKMARKVTRTPVILISLLLSLAASGANGYVVYYLHRELLQNWEGYLLIASPLAAWLLFLILLFVIMPTGELVSAIEDETDKEPYVDKGAKADGQVRAGGEDLEAAEVAEGAPVADLHGREVAVAQLLGLLQREGRLLDFLQEDLDAYEDAQIGAAVREVHRGCKQALHDLLGLKPVLDAPEGSEVEIDEEFDPVRIRLVGNVQGNPPFHGVIRHCGWRYTRMRLPEWTGGATDILAPAEVEIS